jgi:energy-coupling factor transporter ATP-binding protein EcfA2
MPIRRPADNPFAGRRVESLAYRSPDVSWRQLENRFDWLGRRCAIVGPKGSGKTTLLEAIAGRLDQTVAMVRIPGSCDNPWRAVRDQLPRPVADGHAVLVDGCEQLGAIGWRRLLHETRRAAALIVTLHRPGRAPTLVECRTEPRLLRDLVTDLAPEEASHLRPVLDRLFDRHGGNLRLCFRELYDVYAGRNSGLSF